MTLSRSVGSVAVTRPFESIRVKSSASKSITSKDSYHHGDLRDSLLLAASGMVREEGIEGLSLRKLAERVGVSRSAPYHHFKDKQELLSAVAAKGFQDWVERAQQILEDEQRPARDRFRAFFLAYVGYAADNPAVYDLMFGRVLWGQGGSEALKGVAYPSFQYQVTMTRHWQETGLLPAGPDTLRLAQVTWATMHGIARLIIDGIYADTSHVEEMVDCAMAVFLESAPTTA